MVIVLVRGIGALGSAVAHRLFRAGYGVLLHDRVRPANTRLAMACTDAGSEEYVELDEPQRLTDLLALKIVIPVVVNSPFEALCERIRPTVIVDARLPAGPRPPRLRGLAPLTIGLGPSFVAGDSADLVVETGHDSVGGLLTSTSPRPPRLAAPCRSDRCVYAANPGVFRASRRSGELVNAGDVLGRVADAILRAPLGGTLGGLVRDGTTVAVGTRIAEIDRRGAARVSGIDGRLARIAESVLWAVQEWATNVPVGQ